MDDSGDAIGNFVDAYIDVSVIQVDRVNDQAANFFSDVFVGAIAGKANGYLIVYLRHTGYTTGGELSNSLFGRRRDLADQRNFNNGNVNGNPGFIDAVVYPKHDDLIQSRCCESFRAVPTFEDQADVDSVEGLGTESAKESAWAEA